MEVLEKQYLKIKSKYQDAILLIKDNKNDEYKTFGIDARIVTGVYGKVTGTDKVSFPASDIDTVLNRLVKAGNKVAICDQLENPKTNGKIKSGRAS